MIERRIIRGIFIALLILCVAVWLGSYWKAFELSYVTDNGINEYKLSISWGHVYAIHAGGDVIDRPGWYSAFEAPFRSRTSWFAIDSGDVPYFGHC